MVVSHHLKDKIKWSKKVNKYVLWYKSVNKRGQVVQTYFQYIPNPNCGWYASSRNEIHWKHSHVAKRFSIKNWSSHVHKSSKTIHESYNCVLTQLPFYFYNGMAWPSFIRGNIVPTSFSFICRVVARRSWSFVHNGKISLASYEWSAIGCFDLNVWSP